MNKWIILFSYKDQGYVHIWYVSLGLKYLKITKRLHNIFNHQTNMSNKYVIIFFALSHVISNQSNIISIYKINTLKLQWL